MFPTVHLHQQLVQRVLLLALSPEVSSSSFPSHSVDLVDEEDAGSVLPRHDKQISDLHRKWHHSELRGAHCVPWGQRSQCISGTSLRPKKLINQRRLINLTSCLTSCRRSVTISPPTVTRSLNISCTLTITGGFVHFCVCEIKYFLVFFFNDFWGKCVAVSFFCFK